jgi:hypothetical protein
MPDRPLIHRIHSDPAYRDIIKLVTYRGMATPISPDDYAGLVERHGKDRLIRASEALVDIDADKKLATLKAEVRKHCTAILGPAPEEWDEFYAGVANPPPNPYRGEREEIDIVAEAIATAIEEETGMGCEVTREPRQPSPDTAKQPTELDELRQTHGRRLRQLLFAEHDRYRLHAPSDPVHQEVLRRMDSLEAEMRRRGNKVPPRPVWKEPYTPPDDHDVPTGTEERYGRSSNEIADDGASFRPFAGHTTHRLHELLDMCEYEVAKFEPETVTYQEAARDMALIHNELRQREQDDAA